MNYEEAKYKFINTWGSLGTLWGINKAMAQIQALLFITPNALSMEEIMDELKISRGNTSMNLRQLIDWGIVSKELKTGERKEYFATEKDVQELARIIARERSRREIQPVIKVLKEVSSIKGDATAKSKEFIKQTKAMHELAETGDLFLQKAVNQKHNWLTKSLVRWLIILGGIGQIFTALIYPYIRHQVFDWYTDVKQLKPLNQEIAKTYGRYIQGLNFSFGLIAILLASELQNHSKLAIALTGLIALYWVGKVATQIAYYPMYQIPQKLHFKIGSYFMNTLFTLFAVVYVWLLCVNVYSYIYL